MNRIFKYVLMFCFVAIALFAISQMSDGAEAADVVWDGGGADNLASTDANWVGDAKPNNWDQVVFQADSSKNCTMDIVLNLGFYSYDTYHGNVTLQSGVFWTSTLKGGTLILGNDIQIQHLYIQGGNLNTNGKKLIIIGSFEFTSGTIVLGNVEMSGTGNIKTGTQTLYSLAISGTGTITQTGDIRIGAGGYSQTGGTFTGDHAYWVYCAGNFYANSTFTSYVTNLKMSGANVNLRLYGSAYLSELWVDSGKTTIVISDLQIYYNSAGYGKLTIDSDAELSTGVKVLSLYFYEAGGSLSNLGKLSGTGKIAIYLKNSNYQTNFGDIDCPVELTSYGQSANIQFSLNQNENLGAVTIVSESASFSTILNLNGKTFTASTLTIGTRGIVLGGEGSITCSGNWDDANGTFTPENSTVILTGAGYCHTDNPGAFHDLTLEGNTNFVHAVNVDDALILNGQWSGGRIYYNGTSDISTNQQHWTGWLYTQNDIAIEYNSYAYLAFQHDAWLGIQLESWSGTDNFTWNATSVASQTVQWSWSRGESTAMYDEYMDTIYIGLSETNAGGMGEFTSTFGGSHAFLLSRSTFLPASTDIDDSVWLAILFMSIATLINFVGYARKIGLLQIVSFLVLLVGIFTAVDVWTELWTLPTLFILSNAVIFIMGMMRKG